MRRAFWALASPSTASGPGLDTTCQLSPTRLDPAITNTLAVDTHAVYWASSYTAGPGIFANRDVDYVYAPISRGFGEVLVFRGRAPTFVDTRGGVPTFPAPDRLPRGRRGGSSSTEAMARVGEPGASAR